MEQKNSIFGPLLLITAGVIWLLISSGSIPSENLWALTRIWPYLLIAAGLGLILRIYWSYASILVDILIVGGAVLAIVFAPQLGWNSPSVIGMFSGNGFYVGPGEAGSGNVITETRNVGEFTAIEVDYPAQVTVTQGDQVSVKIDAEDNVLPGLKTQIRGNTLEIFYKVEDGKRVNPRNMVQITIVVKDLKDVEFNSAGELTLEGITADDLDVAISGAGNVKLNEIDVKNLAVGLSGAGSATASGAAENLKLIISGFGSFNGGELHSKTAAVTLSGAGSVTTWVDEKLDALISGAGSVNYYGTADVTKNISGAGNVKHLENK
jgi:hypothetical protein